MASLADRIALGLLAIVVVAGATAAATRKRPRGLRGDDDDGFEDDEPEGDPNKWGTKAWRRQQDAKRAAKIAQVEDALATSPAIIIDDGHRKRLILVSGEMQDREYGAFRATTFGDDGPIGHATRKTMADIAKEIATETGYKTLRPASEGEVMEWTSTTKFVEGSKRVAAVQALNTLHFRAKDRAAARAVENRANKLADEGRWDEAVLVLQQGIKDLGRPRRRKTQLGAPTEHDQNIAWVVKDSATRAGEWREGTRKVFIADVYEQLRREGRDDGMTLDEFKHELVRLHRAGALTLSRADLVAAMPAAAVARSETNAGGADFHFVRLDE